LRALAGVASLAPPMHTRDPMTIESRWTRIGAFVCVAMLGCDGTVNEPPSGRDPGTDEPAADASADDPSPDAAPAEEQPDPPDPACDDGPTDGEPSGDGTTWYVATDGDDSAAGTSDDPFLTVQRAANEAGPGDTVIVRDGVYTGTGFHLVDLTRSGEPDAWITFRSENRWGAILDGSGIDYRIFNFANDGMGYYRIEGFDLRNANGNAIKFNNSGQHHFIIRGNRIHGTKDAGGILGSPDTLIIDANFFHDNGDELYGDEPNVNRDHGIYSAGTNVIVKNNVFARHEHGWAIQTSEGARAWKIINNTFAFPNPARDGHIVLWQSAVDFQIENNIFYQPQDVALVYLSCDCRDVVIRNNVTTAGAMEEPGLPAEITDNLLSTDPMVADPSADDFHLRPGSPAIDVGATLPDVRRDFDGRCRPDGAFDVGAFEYAP
jgi:hypothetical protein